MTTNTTEPCAGGCGATDWPGRDRYTPGRTPLSTTLCPACEIEHRRRKNREGAKRFRDKQKQAQA